MDLNQTTSEVLPSTDDFLNKYIRSINLTFSCTGIFNNFILLIILFSLGRHRCTTYFILMIMTLCDLIYCIVYTSILLTIDYYLNIINHQILCPLSFFLTPFAFTGSTLLLFICLIHLITDYVRRYDSIVGQIGGRLSVVFIFAFIIIRSVLGSTSIELISDPRIPHSQHCTIDINTSELVTKVQKINHIFAEVTDILVYIGWIILISIYFTSLIRNRTSPRDSHDQSTSLVSIFLVKKTLREVTFNQERLTNKQRHHDVSLIILSISFISIVLYLPAMINKFTTMELIYRNRTIFTDRQIFILQIIQQTAHLFCLTIRFLPYMIFDQRIRLCLHQMIGMKIQRRQTSSRQTKQQCLQTYMCHFQCSRRQLSDEFDQNNQTEQKPIDV